MLRVLLPACALVVGCARSEPPLLIDAGNPVENGASVMVGRSPPLPLDRVMDAARAELRRREATNCRHLIVPDEAFVPVEVTGGGDSEYAVFLSHARCDGAASYFTGTGGGLIQVWSASGEAPILLMHHSMHGFTPTRDGLISFQHGAFCDNAPGVSLCLVTYQFRGPEDGFEVRSRRLYDDAHPGTPPAIAYDWNYPLPG
jgi:hypothetical protein